MLNTYIRRALRIFYFKGCLRYSKKPMIRLGSEYGGWNVPQGVINPNSICYLAGAGLDISFDVEMASHFKCEVHIFDPTPKAFTHYKELESHVKEQKFMRYKEGFYSISKDDFNRIAFHQIGLWNSDEKVKFYAPQNNEHVSHSVLNLQHTNNYFEADVQRVKTIMTQLGHKSIDLLKIDIEGAEYNVIEAIIEDEIDVKVICVEFDEVHTPLDWRFISRIRKSIKMLKRAGYQIVSIDNAYNITFLKK